MKPLITSPTVNAPDGTPADLLLAKHEKALADVTQALISVEALSPDGADYAPQDRALPGGRKWRAFPNAMAEHVAREEVLSGVAAELREIVQAIKLQIGDQLTPDQKGD